MKDLINERAFTAIVKHYGADYQDGSLSPSVVSISFSFFYFPPNSLNM